MRDSFQRNGSPESSIWKTEQDRFQGYVRAKLEDLAETQEAQWKEHYSARKKIGSLERKSQYQAGGIVAITTLIGIIIAAYGAGLIL